MKPRPKPIFSGFPFGPHTPLKGDLAGFIDTGVDEEHPQLKGLIVHYRDFTGDGLCDDHDHGTQVVLTFLSAHMQMTAQFHKKDHADDDETKFHLPGVAMAKVVGTMPTDDETMQRRIQDAGEWLSSLGVSVINCSVR